MAQLRLPNETTFPLKFYWPPPVVQTSDTGASVGVTFAAAGRVSRGERNVSLITTRLGVWTFGVYSSDEEWLSNDIT